MRRITAVLVAMMMVFSLNIASFAEDYSSDESDDNATDDYDDYNADYNNYSE